MTVKIRHVPRESPNGSAPKRSRLGPFAQVSALYETTPYGNAQSSDSIGAHVFAVARDCEQKGRMRYSLFQNAGYDAHNSFRGNQGYDSISQNR